ncbi:MAG TPA: thiamine pyrophosphate-dependent dehydrogenase E1 component subunit alpha [Bacteroidota bacterium]|nr:thiamine pyrophosphate-dependent dehydrogenase E1 component subunit alpha [Bacteroidota bacterium]
MPPVLTKSKTARSGSSNNHVLKPEQLLRFYTLMRLTREFEDAVLRLYQQGKIVGGAYSGNGNEATSVGSASALRKEDYLFPLHRDMGAHLVKGQSLLNLMLQHLARDTGLTKGRDGTGHYTDPKLRIYGNISPLGAMVPVAVGVALASKLRNEHAVVMNYIGDGGASIGEVHEGLVMASAMRLPFVLIIENNHFAYSTPTTKQFLVEKLSDRAIGYGIPGVTVDGTDVVSVFEACTEAVERARSGGGPSIIESVTMRMHGHAAHDNAWYVSKQLLEEWKKKDPIVRFEKFLESQGILSKQKKESIRKEIDEQIEGATKAALARPYPPGDETVKDVFAR